jgi:hypothetical protein
MWDITVDTAHSFFVGSGAVLVHNWDCSELPSLDFGKGGLPILHGELPSSVPSGWTTAQLTDLEDQLETSIASRTMIMQTYADQDPGHLLRIAQETRLLQQTLGR